MVTKIVIVENKKQEEKDKIMEVKPEIEALGLFLVYTGEEGTQRWEIIRYGTGISGELKKFLGIGSSNNILSYSNNTFKILLREVKLLEDVKKLSEILKQKGYEIEIVKDFLV